MPPKKRTVALPVSPPCRRQFLLVEPAARLLLGFSAPAGITLGFDVAPEGDEQLAGHGHNGDPPCAPGQRADELAEPLRQLAAGLVAKPEPCELDHGRP